MYVCIGRSYLAVLLRVYYNEQNGSFKLTSFFFPFELSFGEEGVFVCTEGVHNIKRLRNNFSRRQSKTDQARNPFVTNKA